MNRMYIWQYTKCESNTELLVELSARKS